MPCTRYTSSHTCTPRPGLRACERMRQSTSIKGVRTQARQHQNSDLTRSFISHTPLNVSNLQGHSQQATPTSSIYAATSSSTGVLDSIVLQSCQQGASLAMHMYAPQYAQHISGRQKITGALQHAKLTIHACAHNPVSSAAPAQIAHVPAPSTHPTHTSQKPPQFQTPHKHATPA